MMLDSKRFASFIELRDAGESLIDTLLESIGVDRFGNQFERSNEFLDIRARGDVGFPVFAVGEPFRNELEIRALVTNLRETSLVKINERSPHLVTPTTPQVSHMHTCLTYIGTGFEYASVAKTNIRRSTKTMARTSKLT